MFIQVESARVTVHTPAKLNLFLEVLARRPDGFHEIETLMAAVGLFDTLIATPRDDGQIEVTASWARGAEVRDAAESPEIAPPGLGQPNPVARPATASPGRSLEPLPTPEKNIVFRALALLQERAARGRGLKVELVKRIPAAAGLGGASSDAAAALIAANEAWGLDLPHETLAMLSAEIGSDIPFFFSRGAAICRGRGERIERVEPFRLHVVVVRPPEGLSTPAVYRACRPAESPAGVGPLREALERGNPAEAARLMLNRLQQPATELSGWIVRLQEEFERQDCLGHQMSGSGSSYFGICRSARQARRTASRLRARRVGSVFATATTRW